MSRDLNVEVALFLEDSDNPESDAINLFHDLSERFGWAGTVMTRADVETLLGRELSDEEWRDVQGTYSWRKAGSIWNEVGVTWDTVSEAVREAGLETDDE